MRWPMWRGKRKNEIEDEIRGHLQMAMRERMERGETAAEARAGAHRELGNAGLVAEVTHEAGGWVWVERLAQDVRYGVRTLARAPLFAAVTVLTLALGIGANTALFSVVNGVLLNPLPYPHPEQLVTLHASKRNFPTGSISYPNFLDWQRDNRAFSAVAISRNYTFKLTGAGEAEPLRTQLVTSDFFSLLGVQAVIGRTLAPGEDRIGAAPVVMLSAGLWKRKFGAAPDVLGKALTLDARDYTIVGVIPVNFDLQLGGFRPADIYVPMGQWTNTALTDRGAGLGLHGIGRLKPGVTLAQARDDMARVTQRLAAAYPENDKGIGASVLPMKEDMVGDMRPFLLVLLGAVGFVLLIACVNVANLLLARANGRAHEFAIRAALGAGRARVLRQLLTESMLLAIAGGGLGLALAAWGTQAALKMLPPILPRAQEVGLDARVLLFTIGLSLLTGIVFGLAPALKMSRPELRDALQESGRTLGGARSRAQGAFVVVEMALALVLLIGAGLMLRTLGRLAAVNPGFNPRNVLNFGLGLPPTMGTAKPEALRATWRQVDAELAAVPGVQALSLSWGAMPMSGDDEELFWRDGQPKPASEKDMSWALKYIVGPGYLKTMQIPLERGRFFSAQDDEHSPLVVVVDEVFARQFFGGENPVGKRVNLNYYDRPAEIVGVVGHVKQWGLDSDDTNELRAQLYRSFLQMRDTEIGGTAPGVDVLIRCAGDPLALFDSIHETLKRGNSQQMLVGAQTMDEVIAATLTARRSSMAGLAVFAGVALLLSSIGIYGLISYLVGQRTREIGIRMALGAQRRDVLRLMLFAGAKTALLGVGIGLVAALGLTRLMASMLYGVSATDPVTFAAVALLLALVALIACWIPTRRAMRVDPIVALRYE